MKNVQETLEKLVSFQTVSSQDKEQAELGKKANAEAMDWVKQKVAQLPVRIFCKDVNENGQPGLLVTTQDTNHVEYLLYIHMDVVPADKKMFAMKVADGKLWGRGVYDMKFALACYLQLFEELGEDLQKYNIGILVTSDEEIGGESVPLILNNISADVCVMPDGGYEGELESKVKGMLQLEILSAGVSAHASRTWEGKNAILQMMDFLSELRTKFICSDDCGGEHFHNTMNVGTISGGTKVSQVADSAKVTIDIRFMPDTTVNEVFETVESISKKYPGVTVTKKPIFADESFTIDHDNKYVVKFKEVASKVLEKEIKSCTSHASSDATYFVKCNPPVPVISTRPEGGGHHGPDEYISIESLDKFYQILKEFITA